MKKFQFAAGLLAMGMLASCQSDAPDAPNVGPYTGEDGEGTYVAMRINLNNATRATASDANAFDYESKINDISMYIYDGTTQLFSVQSEQLSAIDNDGNVYAYFKIGTGRESILKNHAGNSLTIDVYANVGGNGNNVAAVAINNPGDEDDMTPARSSISNWFLMSGKTEGTLSDTKREFTLSGTTDKATAWVINSGEEGTAAKVNLVRLATRFDYVAPTAGTKDAEGFYTATGDENLKIKVMGLAINTHERNTFWFQKSAVTSVTPGAANDYHQKKNTTEAIAPQAGVDTCNFSLSNHNYRLLEGKRCYARPHYVANTVENLCYGYASYVAVKTVFKHATKIGDSKADVYAVDGVLLGTWNYLKGKKASDFVTGATEESKLGYILAAATNGDEATFAANSEVEVFKYDNAAEGYVSYYNRYLSGSKKNIGNKDLTSADVDLQRNHIYQISINSFAGVGQNGTKRPNDPDFTDETVWIDLDVNVTAWKLVDFNTGLEL